MGHHYNSNSLLDSVSPEQKILAAPHIFGRLKAKIFEYIVFFHLEACYKQP